MASVVDVRLVDIAGHTYRQRINPITGSRDRTAAAAEYQQDWQAEDLDELEILTLEVEQIDELLIRQDGDSYVTTLSIDSQVSGRMQPAATAVTQHYR